MIYSSRSALTDVEYSSSTAFPDVVASAISHTASSATALISAARVFVEASDCFPSVMHLSTSAVALATLRSTFLSMLVTLRLMVFSVVVSALAVVFARAVLTRLSADDAAFLMSAKALILAFITLRTCTLSASMRC